MDNLSISIEYGRTQWCFGEKSNCIGLYCSVWCTVYSVFGRNDQAIYVIGSWLVPFAAFCLANLALACLDLAGRPAVLCKYKIQQKENVPMDWSKYRHTMAVAGFNMTVVTLLHTLSLWPLARLRMSFGTADLPGPLTILQYLIVCLIVIEPGFYYLHRLMHQNAFLYKHIHRLHHSWKAPCAMATFYCHPLEHFFVNLLPLTIGPVIAGAHLSTAWLWYLICFCNTTLAHSGYHFPFMPSPERHDFHHSRVTENYGTVGFLDWLHGTNQKFRDSPAYRKHFVIWGFTPASAQSESSKMN